MGPTENERDYCHALPSYRVIVGDSDTQFFHYRQEAVHFAATAVSNKDCYSAVVFHNDQMILNCTR